MTIELLAQLDRVADFVNEATCAVNDHGRAELYKQGLDVLGDIDKMRAALAQPASDDAWLSSRSRTMVEPTNWIGEFDGDTLVYVHPTSEFNDGGFVAKSVYVLTAEQLADVRKKARDDALEGAAKRCESFDELHPEAAFHRVATEIRALKDQPSGEA